MKYIVEFRFNPGCKDTALELFEKKGPNLNPGFNFQTAWVSTTADMAFVLCDSADEASVVNACHGWEAYGRLEIFPVKETKILPYR